MKRKIDGFEFTTLADLKEKLSILVKQSDEHLTFVMNTHLEVLTKADLIEDTLTDGSKVYNLELS